MASLAAQSVLELFAWRDRRYDSTRDALDLRAIVCSYHEGPYLDELYQVHGDLLEKHDFDPASAGQSGWGARPAPCSGPSTARPSRTFWMRTNASSGCSATWAAYPTSIVT